MSKKFQIIVEGVADQKFFYDYIEHLTGESIDANRIIITKGWEKLFTEDVVGRMRSAMNNGITNVVIFDADRNPEQRRKEILAKKDELKLDFELFLLPNNKDCGALEDLLENLINPNNKPIFDCWKDFEKELGEVRIPTKTPPELTIPAKKTKIYAYLETLHGDSKSQKKLIKEPNRDYKRPDHWNLDAEYIIPLKEFLEKYIKPSKPS